MTDLPVIVVNRGIPVDGMLVGYPRLESWIEPDGRVVSRFGFDGIVVKNLEVEPDV